MPRNRPGPRKKQVARGGYFTAPIVKPATNRSRKKV